MCATGSVFCTLCTLMLINMLFVSYSVQNNMHSRLKRGSSAMIIAASSQEPAFSAEPPNFVNRLSASNDSCKY